MVKAKFVQKIYIRNIVLPRCYFFYFTYVFACKTHAYNLFDYDVSSGTIIMLQYWGVTVILCSTLESTRFIYLEQIVSSVARYSSNQQLIPRMRRHVDDPRPLFLRSVWPRFQFQLSAELFLAKQDRPLLRFPYFFFISTLSPDEALPLPFPVR